MNGRWCCLRCWAKRRRAIIVSGLGWLSLNNNSKPGSAWCAACFIWLVMGIGFLASIIHLGSPLRAFNSLTRVGASALSNEIASGALFSPSEESGGC